MRRGTIHHPALVARQAPSGQFTGQQPAPQSEKPELTSMLDSLLGYPALGQASTTARASRTYSGGELHPQVHLTRPNAGPGTSEQLQDTPRLVNSRAAYPNRGTGPVVKSPLMARR